MINLSKVKEVFVTPTVLENNKLFNLDRKDFNYYKLMYDSVFHNLNQQITEDNFELIKSDILDKDFTRAICRLNSALK